MLALAEEQRRLLAADRNHRDDSHAVLQREPHEAGPVSEVDLGGVPAGPVGLMVAARIDEQRGTALERAAHVLRRGGHRPVRREHRTNPRRLKHEVVRELKELALGTKAVIERLREDERVGDQGAARMVAHEQHRPARRDVLQPAHIGTEPDV